MKLDGDADLGGANLEAAAATFVNRHTETGIRKIEERAHLVGQTHGRKQMLAEVLEVDSIA